MILTNQKTNITGLALLDQVPIKVPSNKLCYSEFSNFVLILKIMCPVNCHNTYAPKYTNNIKWWVCGGSLKNEAISSTVCKV